jgi:hypothetical protein
MVLQLSAAAVSSEDALIRFLSYDGLTRRQVAELHGCFAMEDDERWFAERVLCEKANFWLFRCNQKRFCGDFVAIDMSCPDVSGRCARVIELKRGAPLVTGGGGASNQLINAGKAVATIAKSKGVIPARMEAERITGDACTVLAHLGIPEEPVEPVIPRAVARLREHFF